MARFIYQYILMIGRDEKRSLETFWKQTLVKSVIGID